MQKVVGEMFSWFTYGEDKAVKYQVNLIYDVQTNTFTTEDLPIKLAFTV